MTSTNTYNVFRCKGYIVVMHQRGYETPHALTIFLEPRRLAVLDNKLIGFFYNSDTAVILLDEPEHRARDVMDAISVLFMPRHTPISRYWKPLASFITGALLASALCYSALSERESTPAKTTAATMSVLPAQPHPVITTNVMPQTTISAQKKPAANEMNDMMKNSRNALPTSPNAALLSPSEPHSTPRADSNSPQTLLTQQIRAVQSAAGEPTARLQMAKVLKRTAERGMFTISLSSGHERTLYAFLDPNCPECQNFEPAIERLAQEFNVIVFPVSVVKGEASVAKIIPLLCQQSPEKRAAGWRNLFRTDAGMMVPGNNTNEVVNPDPDCKKSATAVVDVNNTGFLKFGFEGTPWVLTDTGYHLPTGLLESATVNLFLKTTDSAE